MVKQFSFALLMGFAAMTQTVEAQSKKYAGAVRVDGSFQNWQYAWQGSKTGRYEARYKLFARNGSLVMCGAGHIGGGIARNENKSALRQARLLIDGEEVMRDLSFFESVGRKRNLDISSSTCVFTGIKATAVPDKKIELVMPSFAIR